MLGVSESKVGVKFVKKGNSLDTLFQTNPFVLREVLLSVV